MHTRTRASLCGPAVVDLNLENFDLGYADHDAQRWTIVVYLQAFQHTQHAQKLAQALPKFKNRDAQLVVVSQDSEFALLQWAKAYDLRVTLVSDKTRAFKLKYMASQATGTLLLDRATIVHESSALESVDEIMRLLDGFIFVSEHDASA